MENQNDLKDKAFDALNKMHEEFKERDGCFYRYVMKEIPGFVIVVTVCNDETPNLKVYRNKELINWYKRVLKFIDDLPEDEREDFSIGGAMCEVETEIEFEFE